MINKNYKIPSAPEYKTEIRKLRNDDPVNAETVVNPLVEDILENIHAVKTEQDDYKIEIENKFSALETNIDWKESVNTYEDILTAYPNPDDGWTVNVKDTDYTYRWTGTEWVAISANAIPLATKDVDGKMSKEYAAKLNTIADKANYYIHPDSGVTAGTYRSVAVDREGHVTVGSNPTTVAGYSISDAYTKNEVNNKLSDLEKNVNTELDNKKDYAWGKTYVSSNSSVVNYALLAEFDTSFSSGTNRTYIMDFAQTKTGVENAYGKVYASFRFSDGDILHANLVITVINGTLNNKTETDAIVFNYKVTPNADMYTAHFKVFGKTAQSYSGVKIGTDMAFGLTASEYKFNNLITYTVDGLQGSTLPDTGINLFPTVKYLASGDIDLHIESLPISINLELYQSRAAVFRADVVNALTEGKTYAIGRGTIHRTADNMYDIVLMTSPDHVPVFWMIRYYISENTWITSSISEKNLSNIEGTLAVNKGGTGAETAAAARTNLGVPPISHAASNTDYGVGNNGNYGHLRLSNRLDYSSGADDGYAATPYAVKQLNETKKPIIRGSYYYNNTQDTVVYAKLARGRLRINSTANISLNINNNRSAGAANSDLGFDGRAKLVVRAASTALLGSRTNFIMESIDRIDNFDSEMFFVHAYADSSEEGFMIYELWVKAYGYYGGFCIEVVDTPVDHTNTPLTDFTTYNSSGASAAQSTPPDGEKVYLKLSDGVFQNKLDSQYIITDFDTWDPSDLNLIEKRGMSLCRFTTSTQNSPYPNNAGTVEVIAITSNQWFMKLYCGQNQNALLTRRGTLEEGIVVWTSWKTLVDDSSIDGYIADKQDKLWCKCYSATDAAETYWELASYKWSAAASNNINQIFVLTALESFVNNANAPMAFLFLNIRVHSGIYQPESSNFNYMPVGEFSKAIEKDIFMVIDSENRRMTLYGRTAATYHGYRLDALKDFTSRDGIPITDNLTLQQDNHTQPRSSVLPEGDYTLSPTKQSAGNKLTSMLTVTDFTNFNPSVQMSLKTGETGMVYVPVGAVGLPAELAAVNAIGFVYCYSTGTNYSMDLSSYSFISDSKYDYLSYTTRWTSAAGRWANLSRKVYEGELEAAKKEITDTLHEYKSENLWRNTYPYKIDTLVAHNSTANRTIIDVPAAATGKGFRCTFTSLNTASTCGCYLRNAESSISAAVMWSVGDWCTWGVWLRANRTMNMYASVEGATVDIVTGSRLNITITTEWQFFTKTVKITELGSANSFVIYENGNALEAGDWIQIHSLMVSKSPYQIPYAESPKDLQGTYATYIDDSAWTPDMLGLEVYETRNLVFHTDTAYELFGYQGTMMGSVTRLTDAVWVFNLTYSNRNIYTGRWSREDGYDLVEYNPIPKPVNNLNATITGSPLDAVQGKVLNDKIDTRNALTPIEITSAIDLNDLCFPTYNNGEWWCRTASYVAAYVENAPTTSNSFKLWLDMVNRSSASEYYQRQRFLNAKKNEYERWMINGEWTDWTIISESGVIAGTYGPPAAASPAAGAAFQVPQITVDKKGRATAVTNRAITLPKAPTLSSLGAAPEKHAFGNLLEADYGVAESEVFGHVRLLNDWNKYHPSEYYGQAAGANLLHDLISYTQTGSSDITWQGFIQLGEHIGVECGLTIVAIATANTTVSKQETFTKSFARAPLVLANAITENPNSRFGSADVVTATGFKCVAYRGGSSGNVHVKWMAIGLI